MQSEVPIQVAVRVRPLIGDEIHMNKDPCLFCIPNQPQLVIGKDRQFSFDYVFSQPTTQKSVYESCVKPLIPVYFEGYNTTVFAYGQTGSGKTYTMGTGGNRIYLDEQECGIIPRAFADIFSTIQSLANRSVCKLRISFIEVYKEETTDLLESSSKNLQIREDEAGNTVVTGVQEEEVQSVDDALALLDAGTAMRHVGSTNMNEESSRSHCIFTLILDQYSIAQTQDDGVNGSPNILSSRFHFVDLAGSERAQRTGNKGDRFKESISINTGLLALGNVISALSDPKRKGQHVPYRESKLTRLLKDSLGGNSKTLMMTCLSPALADLDENINSLKYATRAKNICNKPVVNFDMESSKITRMEIEIEALRGQLQKRVSNVTEFGHIDVKKINDLEIENEKHEVEQNYYLQQLHEINVVLQAVEHAVSLPSSLKTNIEAWRKNWQSNRFDRPISAPSRGSALKRPQNDILENLRNELSKCKEQVLIDNELLDTKDQEIKQLRDELLSLSEINAELRSEIDVVTNNANQYQERIVEQQMAIENWRNSAALSRRSLLEERPATRCHSTPMSTQDRVMQSFRAKSEILISQIDDLDNVEYDKNISSDEDCDEIVQCHWDNCTHKSATPTSQGRHFVSQIPRLTKCVKFVPKQVDVNDKQPDNVPIIDGDAFKELESNRISARDGVRTAELNVREVASRMRELKQNIQLKESLITDLMKSEKEARATSSTFRIKLTKLEKEYEKSKRELEESQEKINNFEKSNNKDTQQKSKLESDFRKKFKVMQKKYEDLKQKETVSNRISSYQETNEKKVKDLEAWIGRMRNQQIELDRKLKEEGEKKSKFEQELRKNEIRIKELELKTDQQQKLLKRKNEEVVAAQRKLRTNPENSKTTDILEQKKQWIDSEIDKIMARQRDIEILEAELRERDESLKKKETLIMEKDHLEIKKTRSSQNLSKSIMHLSVQVETVDEKIQQLNSMPNKNKFTKDLEQLQRVREDLTSQRMLLEQNEESGGLDSGEERRLVELGEAIEAVDEAIQYKNDHILEKQSSINVDKTNNPNNVEHILNNISDLSPNEYKHLLGKQFSKIIDLCKSKNVADEARYHFELQISEKERKIEDLQHMLQVNKSRHERALLEQNSKYEKDIQFLMEQLRVLETSVPPKESGPLEKKVSQLEKELYYYKAKSRKYKDHLKDVTPTSSLDKDESNTREVLERKSSSESNRGSTNDVAAFHLPPVSNHTVLVKKDNFEKKIGLDHHNIEDAKRLQEIFDSKPPSSPSSSRSSSKRTTKKKSSKEDIYPASISVDSVEITGKTPWNNH